MELPSSIGERISVKVTDWFADFWKPFCRFYNLSSITGLLTWWAILLTYIRFYNGLKAQGIDRSQFPFIAPFQPYASYYGFFMISLVIFFNGFAIFLDGNWNAQDFVVSYITIPIFIAFCQSSLFPPRRPDSDDK